jgi:hypothetical protein
MVVKVHWLIYRILSMPYSSIYSHLVLLVLISSAPSKYTSSFSFTHLFESEANVFWEITHCGSSKNWCFGEHITSIIKVIRLFWVVLACSEDMPHDGWGWEPLAMVLTQWCLTVTLESLFMDRCFVDYFLISLPIEGYHVRPKNAVFWDVFAAVTMMNDFWEIMPLIHLWISIKFSS